MIKARNVPDSRALVAGIHVFLSAVLGKNVDGRDNPAMTPVFQRDQNSVWNCDGDGYCAALASIFFSSSCLSASRLKLAPGCIGGKSRKVWAYFRLRP